MLNSLADLQTNQIGLVALGAFLVVSGAIGYELLPTRLPSNLLQGQCNDLSRTHFNMRYVCTAI